ncbi:serine hydrolase domain-containing protein [Phenylobacterium sp.]|jgi:CubicO group peptidase (beta-lactamase class C family)|uniref:serine hydrolase domain-containing protein n=1 Tax=Phenylobacterium sp. TaxID=1871053 RepID=UPI002F4133EB
MWTRSFIAGLALALAVGAGAAAAQGYAGANDPDCRKALDYSAARRGAAVLVLKDGKPICEGYAGEGAPDHAMETASGTKSFVGAMLAAAVQDRLLALDEPVADTVTEWKADPRKAKVTIRQLLSLSSGMPSEVGHPPTYADAVKMPLTAEPGTKFLYGPAPYMAFGEVMRRKLTAAGQPGDPYLYLKRRVLDPIELHPGQWRRTPNGDALLPQGAVLSVREWVKYGEFIRAGGKAGGRQIVDAATLKAEFQPSPANPAYGITWWLPANNPGGVRAREDYSRVPKDMVIARGAGDQRLIVVSSKGITAARLATPPGQGRPAGPAWSDIDFIGFFMH